MGENIYKSYIWEGINIQNTQKTLKTQQQNNPVFSFFFKLRYSWYTLYVTDVQYSDSQFLQIILHL